jgi:hypothetical protein
MVHDRHTLASYKDLLGMQQQPRGRQPRRPLYRPLELTLLGLPRSYLGGDAEAHRERIVCLGVMRNSHPDIDAKNHKPS